MVKSSLWNRLRNTNFYLFELFVFVRFTALYSSEIAQNVLLQDKVCVLWHNQSSAACANIQEDMSLLNATNPLRIDDHIKDDILADSAKFANYIYILQCVPMFLWSVFVGSFLDNYPGGTMIILFGGMAGDSLMALIYLVNVWFFRSLNPYYLFTTCSTYFFTGGYTTFYTAFYKYTSSHSSDQSRSLRFMLLDLAMALGSSFGIFLAGHLLQLRPNPDGEHPQPRTYHWNFVANLSLEALSFVMLVSIYVMDKSRPVVFDDSVKSGEVSKNENGNEKPKSLLGTLLNLDNIRQIVLCIIKPREGRTRLHILTLFAILLCHVFVLFGIDIVMFPFTEKVYHWDSEYYATYSSISEILSLFLMAILTTVLIQYLRWSDGSLLVIAHWSSFIYHGIIGTLLYPVVYFIAIPIGCLKDFSLTTSRAKLSKLVEPTEAGKVFSLVAALEAGLPMLATSAYSSLFAATLESLPGMIYQFSAAIIALSFGITVFEGLYFRSTPAASGGGSHLVSSVVA